MENTAQELAQALDATCKRAAREGGYDNHGFALLLFSFNGPEMTWISNAKRGDMLKVLKEMIQHFEEGTADELGRGREH
jgi:hypothetical protein